MSSNYEDKVADFEVVTPMASITKMGAGANLYYIIDSDGMPLLMEAGSLSLQEVSKLSAAGKKFIEIHR